MDIVTGRRHWPPKGGRGAQMDKGGTHAQQLSLKKAKTKPQKKSLANKCLGCGMGMLPPGFCCPFVSFPVPVFLADIQSRDTKKRYA